MIKRRYPVVFSAFVLLGVLLPLASANLVSMDRYVLVLFPAFFWVADATSRDADRGPPRDVRLDAVPRRLRDAVHALRVGGVVAPLGLAQRRFGTSAQ